MDDSLIAGIDHVHRVMLFGGMSLVLVLEAVRPYRDFPSEGARIRHALNNLGIWLLGFVLVDLILSPHLEALLPAHRNVFWSETPGIPGWLLAVLGLLILDLSAWALHWAGHHLRWLWLLHAVHHSDPHLDATTALRFHPGGVLVGVAWQYLVLFALGLPLWMALLHAGLFIPVTLWQHANVPTPERLDRLLRLIFAGPSMHRLHHSPELAETNSNYGIVFSFWDRLFGTYRLPDPERPSGFGLAALAGPRWQDLPGMLLTPIRARRLPSL